MSLIPRVIVRRWLETLLAAFSLAVIYVDRHRELMPRALDLTSDANLSLWDWLFRGMVFGMMGILSFSDQCFASSSGGTVFRGPHPAHNPAHRRAPARARDAGTREAIRRRFIASD